MICYARQTLGKQQIIDALLRLGELAAAEGETIELVLAGGGVMVLEFGTRLSTRDVDAIILAPPDSTRVRRWASVVATELGWPEDWLNDGVKGFMIGLSAGPDLLTAPGVHVRRPAIEQLLAMKICAWRDEVDIGDARRLLQELAGSRDEVWEMILPFLRPGRGLTARYDFEDLWEAAHGHP